MRESERRRSVYSFMLAVERLGETSETTQWKKEVFQGGINKDVTCKPAHKGGRERCGNEGGLSRHNGGHDRPSLSIAADIEHPKVREQSDIEYIEW
jgi:hypothetical protein